MEKEYPKEITITDSQNWQKQGVKVNNAIVIVIPHLPDMSLGPNGRLHYAVRYRRLRDSRDEMIATIRSHGFQQDPLWEKATLSIIYWAADYRVRDLDNLIGCSKGWIDGLVGEILVDDNAMRLKLIVRYKICGPERTVLRITPK